MNGWQVVDNALARVAPGTGLASLVACFFAWLFYKSSTGAIKSLQKENQRLVDEKKVLYGKVGLVLENSGLDHYNQGQKGQKKS